MFGIALSALSMSAVHDHRGEDGLCHELVAAHRLALEFPDIAAMLLALDLNVQLIAGNDRAAEARAVDTHEIDELALGAGSQAVHDEDRRRLRHGLDDKHARHDRPTREMTLKIRFI